ncbi:hypothetical protein PNOK_0648500 [Pyrrhoderma noxium]|uniref:DUF6533 domain-containing protein n=1 Tax=Pyrrhoderma noxium TaxID=2282107 RepID=A0A286UEQ6_9AGAM|nr:hypothetical protein PNOK_0648500 [Pyrrhoderma noxium]
MSPQLPNPTLTLDHLYALRYLTVSGVVVLIYDALLTLNEELNFIWVPILQKIKLDGMTKLRVHRPVLLYLLARYFMLIISMIYLNDLFPLRSLTDNWGTAVFVFSIDVLVEVLSCGVVLHRLFELWNFGPIVSKIVLVTFFASKVLLFAFAGSSIFLIKRNVHFFTVNENIRFCGVVDSSRLFLGVWITCVTFDVFAFSLLLLNALSRPRNESQRLLGILYKDGIIFFLTIFATVMRSLNLIISAVAPPSMITLGIVFSASMVSTVVSRSFLRLQAHVAHVRATSPFPDLDRNDTFGVKEGYYTMQCPGNTNKKLIDESYDI